MVRITDILKESDATKSAPSSSPTDPAATPKMEQPEPPKRDLKLSEILSVDELLKESEEQGIGNVMPQEALRRRSSILRERVETKRSEGEWIYGDVEKIYDESKEQVQIAMDRGKAGESFSAERIAECTVRMVHSLMAADRLYLKAVYTRHSSTDLVSHAVNVAIFSLKIGMGLDYNENQLIRLGTVALLHDIGMAKLDLELINKEDVLSKEEYEEMKRHPEYSYEMLSRLGPTYTWIAAVVRQEHERINGKGYPRGLTGEEIHEYAQIIGLVDYYEALTHTRPQRRRFLPYDAVKIIVESEKGVFAPRLIKTLLKKISVFPLEGFVKLNTNEVGKVIETSEDRPLRPTVEILYDAEGHSLKVPKVVRLKDTPLIYIIRSVYEEDILGEKNGWNMKAGASHHKTPKT
ncbi:MAG: HD domain-containing protein [Deltaproteobacteria bacterium]|nr:HD domain-containing protein [Deltaproteobacteria bacterium]